MVFHSTETQGHFSPAMLEMEPKASHMLYLFAQPQTPGNVNP
jgi:hypothetical protein